MENEGLPFNWGMAEQIVVYAGDGILLCSKEQWTGEIPCELEWPPGTDAEWKEQKLENIVYRDWYTVVRSNIMDFSTSSNAKTQNNAEGLMTEKATHIQRENLSEQ